MNDLLSIVLAARERCADAADEATTGSAEGAALPGNAIRSIDVEAWLKSRIRCTRGLGPGHGMTLGILKPGSENLFVEIRKRIAASGIVLKMARFVLVPEDSWRVFYAEHEGKPFFDGMVKYMASGAVCSLLLVFPGDAVGAWRALLGATKSAEAEAGTIRGDYGNREVVWENVAHGSDSPISAARELAFFFAGHELLHAVG